MEALVYNTNFEAIGYVDVFYSFIWSDRYLGYGDFELVVPATTKYLELLQQDYYLTINESERVMIIEELTIETDAENGNELKVTGRSLESILERRIIWGQKSLSGNFQNGIKSLLVDALISPTIGDRRIDNFKFKEVDDPRITALTVEGQYTGDVLYDVIKSLCAKENIGFKVVLDAKYNFVFSLYAGIDRSYDQTENDYVIFSSKFENLLSSNYIKSKKLVKNVSLVAGEGEGATRKTLAVGEASGMDRREMFTDANDISSKVTDGKKDEEKAESIEYNEDAIPELTATKIEINASKIEFHVGDSYDWSNGVKVTATYSDNSTKDVTKFCDFIPKSGDIAKKADTKLTASFSWETGLSKPLTVSTNIYVDDVGRAQLKSINLSLYDSEFTVGQKYEYPKVQATATYTDGVIYAADGKTVIERYPYANLYDNSGNKIAIFYDGQTYDLNGKVIGSYANGKRFGFGTDQTGTYRDDFIYDMDGDLIGAYHVDADAPADKKRGDVYTGVSYTYKNGKIYQKTTSYSSTTQTNQTTDKLTGVYFIENGAGMFWNSQSGIYKDGVMKLTSGKKTGTYKNGKTYNIDGKETGTYKNGRLYNTEGTLVGGYADQKLFGTLTDVYEPNGHILYNPSSHEVKGYFKNGMVFDKVTYNFDQGKVYKDEATDSEEQIATYSNGKIFGKNLGTYENGILYDSGGNKSGTYDDFTHDKDISSQVTYDPKAGTVVAKDDGYDEVAITYPRVISARGNMTATDSISKVLTMADYYKLLQQRGEEELSENLVDETFEGEVDYDGTFKYGRDFNIGDIVAISNEYGIDGTSRVTEVVLSHDTSGITVIPTFSSETDLAEET